MRVNGLYGHVRHNDARSLALFAAFVAAFHILAMLGLVVPLAMLDPEHAPLFGWTGYLVRWVPIVTVIGALLFAAQMAWHVRTVRRRTEFRFVDDQDEPRLCRIVEPLAIAAGLPTPYVGVIDSPALNAFACGIRRKDAVLVFTRGLIDGLDDDELAAVAAHEIVHIVNGDIRLMAATNVCLDTLKLLQQRRSTRPAHRLQEVCILPILAVLLPVAVVLVLVVMFLRRLAVDGSHLARLLIASARELIADAEAARLTQNPAALVSALRRIEGRSLIPGLAAGQDAMMIDGAHEGAFATHPTIAERVAAIVAVTGSMALIAPGRRDTRPPELNAGEGFGRRPASALGAAFSRSARQGAGAALARVSSDGAFNRLGLTREMSLGAVAAVGIFLWMHGADLGNPGALARAFDAAPLRPFFTTAGQAVRCLHGQYFGWLTGSDGISTACRQMDAKLAADREEMWRIQLAEIQGSRCFQTERYAAGDRGLHAVTEQPRAGDTISLPRYLRLADDAARRVIETSSDRRDTALLAYFESRKRLGQAIDRFFGDPGLQVAAAHYAGPEHQAALALLRERLTDPRFGWQLGNLEQAELAVLGANPLDFVSCVARRAHDKG
jgi:Zn-dependent protease with chaperone function